MTDLKTIYFPDYSCEELQDWYKTNLQVAFRLYSCIQNIDLSRFKLDLEFKIVTMKSDDKYIHGIWLHLNTVDPFSKEPISVTGTVGFWDFVPEETDVYNRMRNVLHQMIVHEIDECLFIKGEQIFNPHLKE